MNNTDPCSDSCSDLCVVGGGYCGTMICANLVRAGYQGSIALLERSQRAGTGIAYDPPTERLVLNIPVRNMGAWADDPADFYNWLLASGRAPQTLDPASFVSRRWYGDYLEQRLLEALAAARGRVRLLRGDAIGAEHRDGRYRIHLADGPTLSASRLVLAIGNLRPGALPGLSGKIAGGWWCPDPWSAAAHRPCRDGERVLIIGSGLTMIDLCIALTGAGTRPRITVLSRNGLLPCVHATPGWIPVPATPPPVGSTLRQIVRHTRSEAQRIMRQGGDWRAAIDCLRPFTPQLWAALSAADRRRFLRLVRTQWDIHRHRVPPEVIAKVIELQQRKAIRIIAGRILSAVDRGCAGMITWINRADQSRQTGEFDRVINCTGARTSIEASPLLQSLAARGLIRPEEIGLGVQTDDRARAVEREDGVRPDLWVVGPMRRGTLWETTAVPDLRTQVADVAAQIMACDALTVVTRPMQNEASTRRERLVDASHT